MNFCNRFWLLKVCRIFIALFRTDLMLITALINQMTKSSCKVWQDWTKSFKAISFMTLSQRFFCRHLLRYFQQHHVPLSTVDKGTCCWELLLYVIPNVINVYNSPTEHQQFLCRKYLFYVFCTQAVAYVGILWHKLLLMLQNTYISHSLCHKIRT